MRLSHDWSSPEPVRMTHPIAADRLARLAELLDCIEEAAVVNL